jgi:hypothetical protein
VLAPKVRGTLVLDAVLTDECAPGELDFLLLCSSLTAVLGGLGQSDYCAANAFLDTYAHRRARTGPTTVASIGWGRWDGVGIAAPLGGPTRPGAATGPADAQGEPTGHPLLRRVSDDGRTRTYASRFTTADSWVVADHRLMGHGLVPGTAYLELVRAALAERAGDRLIELHDVLFIAPVVVPDGQERTVVTVLEDVVLPGGGERVVFTVRSRDPRDGTWRDNATGWAAFAPRGTDPVRDLPALRAACRTRGVYDSEEAILARARAERWTDGPLRFRVGPRWRVLRRLELGDGRLVATLRLADEFAADLVEYPLHPALLDMAVGIYRLDAEDPHYLPMGYGTLRYRHPLTATTFVHAWAGGAGDGSGETVTCDLELLDADGRVLAEITGYSVKRVHDVPGLMSAITAEVDAAAAGTPEPARTPEIRADGVLAALTRGMSEADALAAFTQLTSAARLPAQLLVCPGDLARLRELAAGLTPELLVQEVVEAPVEGYPRPALDTPFVAPRTDAEHAVAQVWEEILGVRPVGVHDDFFALGGHSLAAVQISTRIRSRLAGEFDLKDFFGTPTVAHLAELLSAGASPAPDDAIDVIDRDAPEIDADDLDGLSDEDVDARLRELLAQDGPTGRFERGMS